MRDLVFCSFERARMEASGIGANIDHARAEQRDGQRAVKVPKLPKSIRRLFQEYVPPPAPVVRARRIHGRTDEPSLIRRLRAAQSGQCYLCGRAMNFEQSADINHPRRASFDHVIPRAQGGKNAGNRLLAHRECNTIKADRMPYPCETLYLSAVTAYLNQVAECAA